MMKRIYFFQFLLFAAIGCRDKYVSPAIPPPNGYLVVEGIINSGDGPTNITLSRATPLTTQTVVYESGATVSVEGSDNSISNLIEKGNGVYSSDQLNLNSNQQYRLHIKTADGKEYISDFVGVKTSPEIDSVNWQRQSSGLQIYVNTHDPQNNTRYYKWDYDETWQIHSPYVVSYKFISNNAPVPQNNVTIVPSAPDSSVINCWQSRSSSQLLIASSAKLTNDVVYAMPINFIAQGSVKLSARYSILVRQYAITPDAYDFLYKLKKNTEQTGSIFDAQPSNLNGNIHCITDPGEQVVGFVSVSSVTKKRIFIDFLQVPGWNYYSGCYQDTVLNDSSSRKEAYARGLVLTGICQLYAPNQDSIISYFGTSVDCVDCTLQGSNIKPPFWQ